MRLFPLVAAIAIAAAAAGVAAQDVQVVYSPGKGITNPVLLKKVDAAYTESSKSQLMRGEVWLDSIVEANGTVRILGVSKSLDKTYGLDDQAVAAAKQWLFTPGKKGGIAVPVRVTLIVEFRNPELGTRSRVLPSAEPVDNFAKGTIKPGDPYAYEPYQLSGVSPAYTEEALRRRIEGFVLVEVIVREDGSVGDARIAKSLDKVYGLDDRALAVARRIKFYPGMYHGQPASFDMIVKITFRIPDSRSPSLSR